MDPHQFVSDLYRMLIAIVCVTVRMQIALLIIPLFNRQLVPGLLRAGIGLNLSFMLVPPVLKTMGGEIPGMVTLVAVILKDAMLGLLIGYAIAVLFWAVEAVGFFIDNQRGASIASTLDPMTGNDSSPLGILFNQAFLVYFMVAGGFGVMLNLMYESYRVWPVLTYYPNLTQGGFAMLAGMFQRIVQLSLLLSAPVIVAMLLAELGLALISRFTPQLQVFFLAMPIKSGIALLVLVVYLSTLLEYVRDEIGAIPHLIGVLAEGLR